MSKPDLFKEVIPAILDTKKDPFTTNEEKRKYMRDNGFIVLRTLSMYPDCVLQANEMNMFHFIDDNLKFDFLLNTIRGYRRKFNYAKATKYDELNLIKEYYNVSTSVAKQYSKILTPDQLAEIKRKMEKGGKK